MELPELWNAATGANVESMYRDSRPPTPILNPIESLTQVFEALEDRFMAVPGPGAASAVQNADYTDEVPSA